MHHIKPKVIKPGGNTRSGKGFSQEELKKAGLNMTEAKKLGVPVDKRRKTAHDKNVKTLKTYTANKNIKTQAKPKPQPKKKAKK
jgi:large subunit ribosomal protein L13e